MADKNRVKSIPKKAWEDSWKWLLGTKLGWIVAGLTGGVVGGLLAGIVGAIVAVVATFGIVFVIHLIITPSHLAKEARHKFIINNASYFSRIFGNKQKRRYLTILELLKSMVLIENRVTDSKVGQMKATPDEIKEIKRKFNEQTNIPLLTDSKTLKIYFSGKVNKTINQTIKKLNLNIMGDIPTENHIEFFIKTRAILDETRFGIADGLTSEYLDYSRKYDDLIQEDEDLPDWVIYLQTIPSGINSSYLWYHCQGIKHQRFFIYNAQIPENARQILLNFKAKRESVINQLISLAEESINKI